MQGSITDRWPVEGIIHKLFLKFYYNGAKQNNSVVILFLNAVLYVNLKQEWVILLYIFVESMELI